MFRKYGHWVLGAFAAGAVLGVMFVDLSRSLGCARTSFVSARSACAQGAALDEARSRKLESELQRGIGRLRGEGKLTAVSLVFRDLIGGSAIEIDPDVGYAPASMLKLPLVLAAYVVDDEQPGFLGHELVYAPEQLRDPSVLINQVEVSGTGLRVGSSYPAEKLLRHAVIDSDNLSYFLLMQYIHEVPRGAALFGRTLRELGIVQPPTINDEAASPREYEALLHRLYDASYLSVTVSEKVLALLEAAKFDSGIVAGVPKNVRVANKFGERFFDDGRKQLHDCGIIYHARRPYSLCIMTKGTDFGALRESLADLSSTVYRHIDESAR